MAPSGRSRVLCSAVLAAGALVCAGCGSPYDATVTGTVLLDSEPLQRGTITFHPVLAGAAAYSQIQSDGTFSLNTGRARGLAPGEYIVTVVATDTPPPVTNPNAAPPIGKLITPARYGGKSTSNLRYTVVPGKNDFTIDLEAK